MFYQVILNFALLFTFTILIYWPFIHYFNYTNRWNNYLKYKPAIIGIAFGITFTILPYFSLDYYNGLIISARFIPLLFCGLLGGPFGLLIAGIIMTITRIVLFNFNAIGIIMSANFLVITIVLYLVTKKIPLNYLNMHRFFYIVMSEITIVLLFAYNFSMYIIQAIVTLLSFSCIAFFAILNVLEQSHFASNRVKQTFALNQIDYLTQLPNNYAIDVHMKYLTMHSVNFSYMHIDIDHFKYYNFEHSYQVGDQILAELSSILKSHAKSHGAYVGRVGGEEFCYIMQDTPPAIAVQKANEIRQHIFDHRFLKQKDLSLQVTVSIGISTFPENGPLLDNIYQHANHALRSVAQGKSNKICHYNQYLKEISRI